MKICETKSVWLLQFLAASKQRKKQGRLVSTEERAADLEKRFWRQVQKTDFCWEWQGTRNALNYGHFRIRHKTAKAHRVAWMICNGDIPKGLFICHACDNPPCVNPAHLWIGTELENIKDRDTKKRVAHGEKHYNCKLSDADILTIFNAKGTQKAIAEKFGIDQSWVSDIKNKKTARVELAIAEAKSV